MRITYQQWPFAVRSFGYYSPEMVVQVPMVVFKRALNEAPEDKRPDWAQEALNSGQSNVLMRGKTFCALVGDEVPQWMLDAAEGKPAGESEE